MLNVIVKFLINGERKRYDHAIVKSGFLKAIQSNVIRRNCKKNAVH